MKPEIYLDNAAATPLLPEVEAAMEPYWQEYFGNPSSIHKYGRTSRYGVETARQQVASLLNCPTHEVVFTSGGTEAVYQALVGAYLASHQRHHIVTTAVEHHAVLHTCEFLESLGAEVTYVMPDRFGHIGLDDLLKALRPDTLLVSVMAVNNETGNMQDVFAAASAIKALDENILVHSDMVQALPVIQLNLAKEAVDMASFSGHKIHGPKGSGALYLRQGIPWKAILRGGNQERQRRGGTENVPGIVGFGKAAEILHHGFDTQVKQIAAVSTAFWEQLQDVPGVYRISPEDGAPTIVNLGFTGVRQDALLMRMDLEGVAASAGSACTAGSLEPSHVLRALGSTDEVLREAVRFSFSAYTSLEEAVEAAHRIQRIIPQLRRA